MLEVEKLQTLLHIFPTFGFGGVPIRIATIINQLGPRYRHIIVSLDGRVDAVSRLDREAVYEVCQFESSPNPLGSRLIGPGLIDNVRRVRAFLKRRRPDLLLTYNWGAIEWAFANTIRPVCRHIHLESGFGVEEAHRQIRRRVLFRRIALWRTQRLVVPSHTLESLATNVWKIDARKVVVVPNGVDLELFAAPPGVTTQWFHRASSDVVVGTVAPLRPEKNVARLLRIFARLGRDRPLRLVIAGDGPERSSLEALAASLGIERRTSFLGHVDKVETLLPTFDIFTLLSETEQMPNSLLQAMAAARAVVAADVGDVKHILSEVNRPYVFAKDDQDALVGAFEALAADCSLRTELGRGNRERACREYGLEHMIASYRVVLEDTLVASREGGIASEQSSREEQWNSTRATP